MKIRIFGRWIGKIKSYKNFKKGCSETLETLLRPMLSYAEWALGIGRNKGTQSGEEKGHRNKKMY